MPVRRRRSWGTGPRRRASWMHRAGWDAVREDGDDEFSWVPCHARGVVLRGCGLGTRQVAGTASLGLLPPARVTSCACGHVRVTPGIDRLPACSTEPDLVAAGSSAISGRRELGRPPFRSGTRLFTRPTGSTRKTHASPAHCGETPLGERRDVATAASREGSPSVGVVGDYRRPGAESPAAVFEPPGRATDGARRDHPRGRARQVVSGTPARWFAARAMTNRRSARRLR